MKRYQHRVRNPKEPLWGLIVKDAYPPSGSVQVATQDERVAMIAHHENPPP